MDNEKLHEVINVSADEAEMIQKFRMLDEHGKCRVMRLICGEYEDAIADFGDKIAARDFVWLKNAVSAVGTARIKFDGGDNR